MTRIPLSKIRSPKLLLPIAVGLLLASCSTKTLINLNLDADSFIPAATRSGSLAVAAGAFDYRFPDDDGDLVNGSIWTARLSPSQALNSSPEPP